MLMKKTNLYSDGQLRLAEIESIISKKEEKLKKAAPGGMRFIVRNGNAQFYLRKSTKDTSGEYVRKNQKDLIGKYMQKSYDAKIIKLLKQEQKLLMQFLEKAANFENAYGPLYSELPTEVKGYISPVDMSNEEYAEIWESEEYSPKQISEDAKGRETKKGEHVRSKSELTIANALFDKNIPYKYEYPLKLKNGVIVHPDFTVLNVRTRKVYYWEHRGMMDNRDYVKSAVEKQKEYIKSGIMIGEELVITEETSSSILSTAEINAVINAYFK